MSACVARVAAAVAIAICALIFAQTAHAARWVIPPGQEALAMRMLGGDLPAGCRFLGAAIQKTEVIARYACAAGDARLALRHPEDATGSVARSKQLAIVVPEGSLPPEALVTTIADRMRAEEASWRWIVEGRSLGRSLAAAGLSARARRLVVPLGLGAAVGFAALIALATMMVKRVGGSGDQRKDAKAQRRKERDYRSYAVGVMVLVGAFAYLEVAYPAAPVHADTTRDLLMAMDCAFGQACDHGPPTTLGVIVQGALWTRFLAFSRAAGASVAVTQAVVMALHATAAVVLWFATRRRFGESVAIGAAALFTVGSAVVLDVPILWNPSIAPLPLAVFHALLFALAEDDPRGLRSTLIAAGAAFSLALAMDCHVLFVVLAPPLFAAIAALAKRPAAAIVIAMLVLAGTLLLDSRTAWWINARAIADAGAAIPLAALLLSAVGGGVWARSRLATLDVRARAMTFIGVAAVCATGMTALLFAALGAAAGRRYLLPAVPGMAIGVAVLGAWMARRWARTEAQEIGIGAGLLLSVCTALRVAAPRVGAEGGFTIREMEIAAREVYKRAPTHRDVVARVHARSSAEIAALSVFEPKNASGFAARDEEWLLLKRSRAGAPLREVIVDLGREVVVLAKVTPRFDRSKTTFCFAPRRGVSEDQGCVEARIGRDARGPTTPEERAYPALATVRDAFPPEMLSRFEGGVKQTIRVAIEGWCEASVVALMDKGSGYRIEGAAGGLRAVVEPGAREIVVAREDGGEPRADRYWPPEVWEVPAGDEALVKLLDEASRGR